MEERKLFGKERKRKLIKSFQKSLKTLSYPIVPVSRIEESVESWERGHKASGIVDVFVFGELDKIKKV